MPARNRRVTRTLVTIAVLGTAGVGAGLLVGGVIKAREETISGSPISDSSTTLPSTTTTAAPTTTSSTTSSTTTTAPTTTTTAPPAPPAPMEDGKLELGEAGDEVAALQGRLEGLGFWLGSADGRYGQLTRQAVMAFQKANGLGRDGVAGPATLAALETATRPVPRDPSTNHIEVDLDRQIVMVVEGGQVKWTLNTSTGNGEAYANGRGGTSVATTPPGTFSVQREIDGLRHAPLGTLYRPKYFNGGIAIHGSGSVPAQPASHGCVRLTNAAMDLLWASGAAPVGTTVVVY